MKKFIAALMLLAFPASAFSAPLAAPVATIHSGRPLALISILAAGGGYTPPGTNAMTGSGAVFDPIVPLDGTQNITGGVTATGGFTADIVGSGGFAFATSGVTKSAFYKASNGLTIRMTDNTGFDVYEWFLDGATPKFTVLNQGGNGLVESRVMSLTTAKMLSAPMMFEDASGNMLAKITDGGTTGGMTLTSSFNIVDTIAGGTSSVNFTKAGAATFSSTLTANNLQVSASNASSITSLIFASATSPATTNGFVNYDGTNMIFNVPSTKGWTWNVAGSAQATLSNAGALTTVGSIKPTSGGSGAATLVLVGHGTYVIDFGAFTAGVNQTSAQALTGVAFGDTCSVGTSIDQSASIGVMGVQVTSAGNLKIVISPITIASTADPASATYTVNCYRAL